MKIKRTDIDIPEEEPPMDAKKQKEFDELPEDQKKAILEERENAKKALISKVYIEPKIIDNDDGTYTVRYKVTEECKCEI